jgi:hypothetical protein
LREEWEGRARERKTTPRQRRRESAPRATDSVALKHISMYTAAARPWRQRQKQLNGCS